MNTLINLYIILIVPILFSCAPKENLEEKIAQLEQELDVCKNGTNQFMEEIMAAAESNDIAEVKRLYAEFTQESPAIEQIRKVDSLHQDIVERQASEERAITLEKRNRKAAIQNLRKSLEDGVITYRNSTFTHFDDRNLVSFFITENKAGTYRMKIKMSYTGNDWIYFKNAFLSFGSESIEIPFDRFKEKKSGQAGSYWESFETSISERSLTFLRGFAKARDAKMKLVGKHTESRSLSPNERNAILDILKGYDALTKKN